MGSGGCRGMERGRTGDEIIHVHVHVHDQSVIETRQRKATTPEDSSYMYAFSGKKRAGLEPATSCIPMLYQLSHQGSSAGQARVCKLGLCKGKGSLPY